jgi:excisionase family DNA binding protein
MPDKREIFSLDGVRKFLHISPNTAKELAESGAIPGRRIGKNWKFYREDIIEWVRIGNQIK